MDANQISIGPKGLNLYSYEPLKLEAYLFLDFMYAKKNTLCVKLQEKSDDSSREFHKIYLYLMIL